MTSATIQKSRLYELLLRPIVTEKSIGLSQLGQYVFEVALSANKVELTKAFELAFPGRKVKAIRLIKMPARSKRVGRHTGHTGEKRKAVFSIIGEPLEFITGV